MDLVHGAFTQASQPSMQGAIMRGNAWYSLDGLTKTICRCNVVITGSFNDRQTKGLVGKDLDRKHAKATLAFLAKSKGDRAFLVDCNTVWVKQDTVSFDQPVRQPQGPA